MQAEIIIIGAGVAGLMAGKKLAAAGCDVLILDKGRRIGGRMASRREAGLLFNHGAQFVTAHSPIFAELCKGAAADGIMEIWSESGRDTAYSGRPSMRDIASFIGAGLPVHQQIEIEKIDQLDTGGFTLQAKNSTDYHCQHLLVTAPAPQTMRLLQGLSPELAASADSAEYAPCWTVMAGLDKMPAGVEPVLANTDIIGWASCEASRPGAQASGAVTIQASAEYSREFLESPPEIVIADLLAAFAKQQNNLPLEWVYQRAHRWRYAKVIRPAKPDAPFMDLIGESIIAVAGDWHPVSALPDRPASGARAEEAVLSGYRAANEMLAYLANRG